MKLARGFFSHGSNSVLVIVLVVAIAAALAGRIALGIIPVLVGVVLFFLSEYGTHRFLLHASPAPWAWLRGYQHRLHYDHHTEPDRLDLLFLPIWFLVPVLTMFALIYAAITHNGSVVASLITGNVIGLLFYEWTHYVAHVPFRPLTPSGRYMKKYHLWHHFKNEKYWFGVTNPGLDFPGRTYLAVTEADRSDTTRTLFPS
jgi:hypothetical protein